MIVTGGENVYSAEVEEALYRHPAVAEAAVIAIPHERWGEAVHAVVTVASGTTVSVDGADDHCSTLIAGYKVPKSMDIRADPLPRTGGREDPQARSARALLGGSRDPHRLRLSCYLSHADALDTGSGIPQFARSSTRITDAYRFARDAHARASRPSITPPPSRSCWHETGYPEHVVVAALLHDVVEDSPGSADELAERFGPDVARLVAQLTEDPGIDAYDERKRELRRRAASDGHSTASIFTADKLASARKLNASGGVPDPQKLEHYERTVNVVRRHHPEVPFLPALEDELARMRARVG